TSQILARKSSPVETSRVPSRFQASPKIESVCPRSVSTLSAPEVPERVTVPSLCPAARSLSSGLQAPVFTPLGWATSAINRTVSASQILMVPFWPQAATRVPSELNATEQTGDLCPRKPRSTRPVPVSQVRTVPPLQPAASLPPSGLHASHLPPPHQRT